MLMSRRKEWRTSEECIILISFVTILLLLLLLLIILCKGNFKLLFYIMWNNWPAFIMLFCIRWRLFKFFKIMKYNEMHFFSALWMFSNAFKTFCVHMHRLGYIAFIYTMAFNVRFEYYGYNLGINSIIYISWTIAGCLVFQGWEKLTIFDLYYIWKF